MRALFGVSRESPFFVRDLVEMYRNSLPYDMSEQLTVQYMGYGVEPDPDVLLGLCPLIPC